MLPTHHTSLIVAILFIDIVSKIHGMPRSLIFDRDPLFISGFWQELFKLSGTRLKMSSAYHPQMDGQTMVLNRVIEQCCVHLFIRNQLCGGNYFIGLSGHTILRNIQGQEFHRMR